MNTQLKTHSNSARVNLETVVLLRTFVGLWNWKERGNDYRPLAGIEENPKLIKQDMEVIFMDKRNIVQFDGMIDNVTTFGSIRLSGEKQELFTLIS